jgi:glycosyltransferase involved in cell wall biosynthesis
VINFDNFNFIPEKKYDFFVGSRTNFQRISELLNPECVKIVHLTVAHWLFNNTAQYERLSAVKKRKGAIITPRKMVEENYALENADYATILGNEFTVGTYSYAGKQIFAIPISTPVLYPWTEDKNFYSCRNNFIWFGSDGLVHKGLDLVLEAFVDMPDMNLTVCGPVSLEKDFENAYYNELYHTPNIKTVGWVDIGSPVFDEITMNSIGLIYPSCSEGQSGGVLTCLHASLIPVVSYESGVSVADFGVILKQSSIAEIKNAVRAVSNLTAQQAKSMARKAWEYATANHTREAFSREYNKVICMIMGSN